MSTPVYPFPEFPADTNYCVFPNELEEDELVFFHATHCKNLQSILSDGFKIPDPSGIKGLDSISFGKNSVLALTHAMLKRSNHPGEYCIIAVRYATLKRKGLAVNSVDIHDRSLDPPPKIIGYTMVPESYRHE